MKRWSTLSIELTAVVTPGGRQVGMQTRRDARYG